MDSDSGKPVHYSVCRTCSTIVRVEADFLPDVVIVKPGTLDDIEAVGRLPVTQEIFARGRPDCFEALRDVKQAQGPG